MPNIPIVWPVSGGYQLLELPPGFNDNSYVDLVGISGDGSVVIGYYSTQDGSSAGRWDNGVLTTLTGPDATSDIYPYAISQDGNTVVGVGGNSTNVVRWTTPTNGTSLPHLPGDTSTRGLWNQLMSDDGWIIVGVSMPSGTNTVWVNGVANSWGTFPQNMRLVSGDGLTIAGGDPVGYWRSHVFHPLTCPSHSGSVVACNGDGTIIYGNTADADGVWQYCYWDNLTSVTGSADFGSGPVSTYGTVHYLLAIGSAGIDGTSRTGNTAVGSGSNYIQYAIKWDNGVFHNYQPNPIPPGGISNYGRAYACSGDGSIVVGQQLDEADNGTWACYWDTDNVLHKLPRNVNGAYGSIAFGISRDGTKIYGTMFVDTTVSTTRWSITGAPGAVGDVWSDPSYMDFSDPYVRSQFINQDNSWKSYGYYGEDAGAAPILFLAAKDTLDPSSILRGWGSYGRQTPWLLEASGNNPTTGEPYAALVFDDCGTSTQWKITSKYTAPEDGGIGDLWMDQRYVDFNDPHVRQKFIKPDKSWVYLGYYGEAPVGTAPRIWNTINNEGDPTDFTYGWGQGGTAPGWNVVVIGKDPTTNEPYPDMSFDDCVPPLPSKQPVVLVN